MHPSLHSKSRMCKSNILRCRHERREWRVFWCRRKGRIRRGRCSYKVKNKKRLESKSISKSISKFKFKFKFEGLFLYTGILSCFLFHAEWCTRHPWCPSIISSTITTTGHYHWAPNTIYQLISTLL